MIERVQAGEKIRAGWTNSLVDGVNSVAPGFGHGSRELVRTGAGGTARLLKADVPATNVEPFQVYEVRFNPEIDDIVIRAPVDDIEKQVSLLGEDVPFCNCFYSYVDSWNANLWRLWDMESWQGGGTETRYVVLQIVKYQDSQNEDVFKCTVRAVSSLTGNSVGDWIDILVGNAPQYAEIIASCHFATVWRAESDNIPVGGVSYWIPPGLIIAPEYKEGTGIVFEPETTGNPAGNKLKITAVWE